MTKINVLTFIYLFALPCIWNSNGQYNFFMAKKLEEDVFTCVTNTTYALSWLTDDIESPIQQVSTFIPKPQDNAFDCDIENDDCTNLHYIKNPWLLKNTLHDDNNEIILDRRWEDFKTYLTKSAQGFRKPFNFIEVASNINSSFELPFSVRIEKEANIFLCDNKKPFSSNCYWFSLCDSNGKTTLKKCENENNPDSDNINVKGSCQSVLNKANEPYSYNYLSKDKWLHFKLTKKENRLSLSHFDKSINNDIITYVDNNNAINVTNVIVSSKSVNGLWKIHQFHYLFTNQVSNKINVGPYVNVVEGSVCISMFITVCSQCRLKLTLTKYNNQSDIIREKMYWLEQPIWTEIKLLINNIYDTEKVALFVSTIGQNQDARFWGIDKIRLCQKEEFRKIDIKKEARCQLISDGSNTISFRNKISEADERCPENTIGNFCVPCNWIYRDCTNIQICERHLDKTECTCSSGCQGITACKLKCYRGYYGHNCQKQCGKCSSSCDKVDGTCSKCIDNYSGTKCDTPPSIIFREPPEIKDVSFTEIKIIVNNFQIENRIYNDYPKFYLIQYKKNDGMTHKWTSLGNKYRFSENRTISLDNLEIGTEYLIRSIITSVKDVTFPYDNNPSVKVKTKYTEITPRNIDINPSSTSAKISLKEFTGPVCRNNECPIIFISDRARPKYFQNNNILIEELIPFTTYKIFVDTGNTQFEIPFRTTEGVPSQIQNFTSDIIDDSTIKLQWKEPLIKNGIIKHYLILVECQEYVLNKSLNSKACVNTSEKVEKTSITIKDLSPGQSYSFTVSAVNNLFQGEPYTIQIFISGYQQKPESKFTSTTPRIIKPPVTKFSEESCHESKEKLSSDKNMALSVYSKDEDSLSIRWKSSSSLTVSINYYYCDDKNIKKNKISISISSSRCTLWPNFQCVTLNGLESNRNYVVQGQVANFINNTEVTDTIQTITKIEPSEAPDNLTIKWTLNNDLILEWNHPNITNGKIQYFNITIISQKSNTLMAEKLNIIINQYNLTYYHMIEAKHFTSSTQYNLTVNAYNGHNGKGIFKIDTSPPNIPSLKTNPEILFSNEKDIVNFIPDYTKISENDNFTVFLLISPTTEENEKLKEFKNKCAINKNDFKNIYQCKLKYFDRSNSFISGIKNDMEQCFFKRKIALKNSINYATVLLINSFKDKTRCGSYSIPILYEEPILEMKVSLLPTFLLYVITGALLIILIIVILVLKCYYFPRLCNCPLNHIYEEPDFTNSNSPNSSLLKSKRNRRPFTEILNMIIKKPEFEKYVKECFMNGTLEHQHSLILTNPLGVKYEEPEKKNFVDYIDFIGLNGVKISRAYMIMQAPTLATIKEFWKIIWKEGIEHIVNLSGHNQNGQEHDESFWPLSQNKPLYFGKISIQLVFKEVFEYYEYKEFQISEKNKSIKVTMLHFTTWPKNDDLLYSQNYVQFFEKMTTIPLIRNSPILFFCKTGLKGVGFALLCDMCLRIIENEETIDIVKNVHHLCEINTNLVSDVNYYKMIHLVILEFLTVQDTNVPYNEMEIYVKEIFENEEIYQQMCYLDNLSWLDQASILIEEKNIIIPSKIHSQAIVRNIQEHMFVAPSGGDDINSSYINAVNVDGFRSPDRFIVTQQPVSDNLGDFWRLVNENDISIIISLNEINTYDRNCCNFWPSENHPEMTLPNEIIFLRHEDTWSTRFYDLITVQLHLDKKKEHKIINIMSMKKWTAKSNSLPNIDVFLEFWEKSAALMKNSNRVIITCYDGIRASGLYVTLSFILEQIQFENMCDVCNAVRRIRRHRIEFIQDEVQLCFLYEAALQYITKTYDLEPNYEIPRTVTS